MPTYTLFSLRESLFPEYTEVSVSCANVYAFSSLAKTRSSERSDLPLTYHPGVSILTY